MRRVDVPSVSGLERHEQQEVATLVQRFADLSSSAQLEAFILIREYLDGGVKEVEADHELMRRKAALEALRRVARELGLPDGRAPTTTEFRETAKRLGLDWSVAKVGRAWERWRFACEAYTGHHLRRTAAQQGVLDAHTGKRRVYEDYIPALRIWLEKNPPAETIAAYDRWAQEFNEVLPHNQKPVPRWDAIYTALRVSFQDALRVARRQTTLDECPKRLRDHTKEWGPLVSCQWMAGEYGLSPHHTKNVPRRPDFPRSVAILSGTRTWLKDDVRAYFDNRPFPKREEFELQDEYFSLAQLAALMGKKPKMFSQTTLLPKPAGLVSRKRYWRRAEVEEWLAVAGGSAPASRAGR